ncbi:thiamine phosphate synthase [Thioalkalivibrio sp. HK1]|uniref:thiamine phosphate synthase n=1 Tax=Thioalkalivibrio sp. HK1 TaxID=1469245 RepID=UPI000472DCC2|nr:thiamine phosphate synthase [Thioalkalivibrio sp. HK1]
MTLLPACGLYAITAPSPGVGDDPDLIAEQVDAAIKGGAAMIQYRDKDRPGGLERSADGRDRRRRTASRLAHLCQERGIPLIINDDPSLALEVGADGVHIGIDDGSLEDARRVVGEDRIVGVSCYDRLDLAIGAADKGADYVAFGSFFPSSIKTRAVRPDISILARAKERIDLPIVAIGGITAERAPDLIAAGASLIAAITGVFANRSSENDGDEERGILANPGLRDIERAARGYARLFPPAGDRAHIGADRS